MLGLDSTYETFSFSGDSANCYGLEIVRHTLKNKGVKLCDLDYASDRTVLVSLYWPEQLYDFIRWRYSARMKNKKVIIGGNYPTTSPQAVAPFCDGIYMGDGELWDGTSETYMAERGNPKERATAKLISPYLYEDVQQTRRTFIEMSRGCKNKCLFCQYGWLKPYRECDIADIKMCIDRAKTKSIRVFAADRFQHSSYKEIRQAMIKRGKTDTGSDISIRWILKHPEYLQYTKKVRIGVEGLSFRLRKMVGKNYNDDDIVRFCTMVADAGIKSLDWYMIYGLPTETDDDVVEFETLLDKLNSAMPNGYTIAIHWNAFTPSAQTPLQWAAPAVGEFSGLRKMFSEYRRNDRIKIYHKPKLTSYDTIVGRMLAIRSTSETAKLVFNFANKRLEMLRKKGFLLAEYERLVGAPLMGEWPIEKSLPWDEYCVYDKDLMLRLYYKVVRSQS